MLEVAEKSGCIHMVGFNDIRSPASQLARQIIAAGEIGDITYFRGEHTEVSGRSGTARNLANQRPRQWQHGRSDAHIINAACALIGPIASVSAEIETVHKLRPTPTGSEAVTNDDDAHITCRFESGTLGSLYISRIATGRKMGYAYEMFGTKGAIRFDQEDQNALWLYKGDAAANRQGFTKILTGPQHPDYEAFCLGPGHGTGYQDQIIIEARDFREAIADGKTRWPSFRDGMIVNQIIEAAWKSQDERRWVDVSAFEFEIG